MPLCSRAPSGALKRSPCGFGEEVVKKAEDCEGEMGLQELSQAEPRQGKRQRPLKSRGGKGLEGQGREGCQSLPFID